MTAGVGFIILGKANFVLQMASRWATFIMIQVYSKC